MDGNGYTLGPITADHWFVFVADQTIRSNIEDLDNDRVLNIMMFDIDEEVADIFYYDHYESNKDENETKDENFNVLVDLDDYEDLDHDGHFHPLDELNYEGEKGKIYIVFVNAGGSEY